MLPSAAPWSQLGQLESEINNVRRDLSNKAESHEVRSALSRLDSVERTIGGLESSLSRLEYQLQELQENFRQLTLGAYNNVLSP